MSEKVDLAAAFAALPEPWKPRVVAEVNDFMVRIARVEGEFFWHQHETADELFLVMRGRMQLRFRDRDDVWLEEGDLYVVPHGVEHLPVAPEECHVLLVERKRE